VAAVGDIAEIRDWLTVSQAARILGLSSSRVHQLGVRQEIAARTTPLGRLFDPADVERYRKEREQRSKAQ